MITTASANVVKYRALLNLQTINPFLAWATTSYQPPTQNPHSGQTNFHPIQLRVKRFTNGQGAIISMRQEVTRIKRASHNSIPFIGEAFDLYKKDETTYIPKTGPSPKKIYTSTIEKPVS